LPSSEERFGAVVQSEMERLHRESRQVATAGSTETNVANGDRLPWKPFSKELLVQLTREGKTVMVDFTAEWCANCKVLEKAVLNTANVKSVAIFPASNPNDPIVFKGGYTQQILIDALNQAGPSKSAGETRTALNQ
jgi:thiol-disulfide isomerase/thioredoxin